MNMVENFTLVDGKFSAQDAREILLSLINNKIKFHELKNFSHEVRYSRADNHSVMRIAELKACRESLKDKLKMAVENNTVIRVHSSVVVEFVNEASEKASA
jgi:hypothetical protein